MSILGGAMIKVVFSCLLSMSGGNSFFFPNRGAPVDLRWEKKWHQKLTGEFVQLSSPAYLRA